MILTNRAVRKGQTRDTTMKISTIIAAAAVVLFTTAAGAEPVKTQVEVRYSDLNLASPDGKAALAKRIEIAANTACGVGANQRDLALISQASRCHAEAVATANVAIASVTAPVLASR
ncbi:MAG: UrcA family protein [Sandarakinorhabdus sp.]|nr:UrcA family protein [Sandarakinorhabdus sp.]